MALAGLKIFPHIPALVFHLHYMIELDSSRGNVLTGGTL
jgi:hypothetical protein